MHLIIERFHSGRVGAALLALRVVTGIAFIFHGLPKVRDPAAFAEMMQLPPALGFIAAWTEVLGGALLVLGLLTPVAALFLTVQMLVAIFRVHLPAGDPFVGTGGSSWELAAVYLVVNVALLLAGPGAYSLDALLARRLVAADGQPGRRRGLA
ncbi:MAG: DoxX family protein [Armatimonadota bacterium]